MEIARRLGATPDIVTTTDVTSVAEGLSVSPGIDANLGIIAEAPSVRSDRSEGSRFSHSPTDRTYELAHSDSVPLSSDDDPEDPISSDVPYEYSGPAASEAGPPFYGSPMFDWLILEDKV